jgi:hypothetical protein
MKSTGQSRHGSKSVCSTELGYAASRKSVAKYTDVLPSVTYVVRQFRPSGNYFCGLSWLIVLLISIRLATVSSTASEHTIAEIEEMVEADYRNPDNHLILARKYAERFEREGPNDDNSLGFAFGEYGWVLSLQEDPTTLQEFQEFFEKYKEEAGIGHLSFDDFSTTCRLIVEAKKVQMQIVSKVQQDVRSFEKQAKQQFGSELQDVTRAFAAIKNNTHEVYEVTMGQVRLRRSSDGAQVLPATGFYQKWEKAIRSYGFRKGKNILRMPEVFEDALPADLIQLRSQPYIGCFRDPSGSLIIPGLQFIRDRLTKELGPLEKPLPPTQGFFSSELEDLESVLHDADKTTPRNRFIVAAVKKVALRLNDISSEADVTDQDNILADLKAIAAETRFIACLGLAGYEREENDETWFLPDVVSVDSWLDQLSDKGLIRERNLLDMLTSRQISNPDDFYVDENRLRSLEDPVKIPSMDSVMAKLSSRAKRAAEKKKYLRQHGLRALEADDLVSKDSLAALSEEIEQAPPHLQQKMLVLERLQREVIEARRENIDIMRETLAVLDALQKDFDEWWRTSGERAFQAESPRIAEQEFQRSMSVIEWMKSLIAVDDVLVSYRSNKILFYVVGKKQVDEFAVAMHRFGVARSEVAEVKPFTELSLEEVTVTSARTNRYLGLQALERIFENPALDAISPQRSPSAEKKIEHNIERIPTEARNPEAQSFQMRYDDTNPLVEFQKQQAAKGFPPSQYVLGIRYLEGIGVEKNAAKGKELLNKAAAQGHLNARDKIREIEKKPRLPR